MFRIVFFLFCFSTPYLSGSAQVRDLQSWTGIQLGKDFGKKIEISASFQMRRQENLLSLRQIGGEFAAKRKLTKHLYLSAGARAIYAPDRNTLRLFVDFGGDQSFNLDAFGMDKYKLTLSGRLRFQDQVDNIPPSDFVLRPKVKTALERKKWVFKPWLAAEEYIALKYGSLISSRFRAFAGLILT